MFCLTRIGFQPVPLAQQMVISGASRFTGNNENSHRQAAGGAVGRPTRQSDALGAPDAAGRLARQPTPRAQEIVVNEVFDRCALPDRRRAGRRNDVAPALIPLLRGKDDAKDSPVQFPMRAVVILVAASTGLCTTIGIIFAIVL